MGCDQKDGTYRQIILENIGYRAHEQRKVDELAELMVEVMVMPEGSTVRIACTDKPAEVVKSRFMKLNHSHIEHVLRSLERNTTKVGNIKAYLLTVLYNASVTISQCHKAEAVPCMCGSG